jgi:hypothetical protein
MAEARVQLRAPVAWRESAAAPRLTLRGRDARAPHDPLSVACNGTAGGELPPQLGDVLIEPDVAGGYRLTSGAQTLQLAPGALHVHRDVGIAFYRAIPPRRPPWLRRLFWNAVVRLARSALALRLLRALRG